MSARHSIALACSLALVMVGCERTGADSAPSSAAHASHAAAAASTEHAGHGAAAAAHVTAAPTPEGYANITLSPAGARGLALTTTPVEESDFTRELRTVGAVVLDETKTSHVHSKVRGWIETVHVDFTGKRVRSGQPLVTIYSQEVYAAELE
jgi:Cu(I)/Ag(I) efflux system membrane fusion protein